MLRTLCLTTPIAVGLLFAIQPLQAQDSLQTRFLDACDASVQRNNPLYTVDQRREICACRYDYVVDELSPAEMEELIDLFGGRDEPILGTSEKVDQARVDSLQACFPY
ncbi:MAG: hypothetical protein GVY13_07305 [Alphaproteobacteria bacterium]|jgi:hypothetical protein|nr:hypothetical protein [Alphaproteobacteria bacterium]